MGNESSKTDSSETPLQPADKRAKDEPTEKDRLTRLNKQTEGIKEAMRRNFAKVMRRGDQLETLETKAEEIELEADEFKKGSTELKNKERCKNFKLWCILITIIVIIVAVLAIILIAVLVALLKK